AFTDPVQRATLLRQCDERAPPQSIVGTGENRGGNVQTKVLGGFQIDHKLTIRQTRDCLRCTTKPPGTYHGPGGFPLSVERRSTPRLPTPLWVVRRCRARSPTLKS